jgi:glyoxylase-like metal-dependent hydrolase (beta-lactamase superfamily II)
MQEQTFGPIRFIPGENRGKYPFCHSVYIEEEKILIDPASDRKRLIRLREESGVEAVWLSHWHEDHIMHLDLFDDLPMWISPEDAPMLSDMELFLDGYAVEDENERQYWATLMTDFFHFKPRNPSGFLKGGETVRLKSVSVDIIAAPGHTPGHRCFFFREPEVLFLGDYDLTAFGPWYGDRQSSIPQTITSVRQLEAVPAKVWLTCHETGVFTESPGKLWEDYLQVIQTRENKLLKFLELPRTMEEIVNAWIVYLKPREPADFYAFAERALMKKHLEELIAQSKVELKDGKYFRKN